MTKSQNLPGKLQWLRSVQLCLKGLIGTYGLLLAWEGANIIFNPQHTVNTLGLVLNWHFMNILQLMPSFIIFLVAYYLSQPVEQGLRENEAKLFFTNLKEDYTHLKQALQQEEGKLLLRELIEEVKKNIDTGKPKKQSKVDNQPHITLADSGTPPMPWHDTDLSSRLEPDDVDS